MPRRRLYGSTRRCHIYSKGKEKFGIQDDFASRILGLLSRKKQPAPAELDVEESEAPAIAPLHAMQDNEN
jgi:hypothetical protein